MQTITPSASASALHPAATQLNPADSRVSPHAFAPALVRSGRRFSPRTSNIDSLLKIVDAPRADSAPLSSGLAADTMPFEGEFHGGVFFGLRSALLLNAGVGIFAMLAYEAWTALAH